MFGVRVRVQEAHRDRLNALGLQRFARLRHARLLDRGLDLAATQHSLRDLQREPPRHQRAVAMEEQVVGLRAIAAADDVNVTCTTGNHQGGPGALALDQRVDRDRRAVDQLRDRAGFHAALLEAVDHAVSQLGRRGQALGLEERPRLLVETDQIGECSAYINRYKDHAVTPNPVARVISCWLRSAN